MYNHALEILRKTILPYVIGVHGLDVSYPALLIGESGPISESGSVVFRIDERGSLVAEYFGHKSKISYGWDLLFNQGDRPKCICLVDTDVEIPISNVKSSPKTSTIYNYVAIPPVTAYDCGVYGWIGDASAKMTTAVATLDGCAVLPLLNIGERSFLDAGEEASGLPVPSFYDSRTSEVIQLTADGWKTTIHSYTQDKRSSLSDEPPYSIRIRKCDDSTFELSERSEILRTLRLLFSFSSERWVQYSTICGWMSKARPDVVNRAFIGRFASRGWSQKRDVDISELGEWPRLFQGLWEFRESAQMRSALIHLISCGDRAKDGVFSHQDLVDAYGALEAAVRLWNDLDPDYRFYGDDSHSLTSHLHRAATEAKVGDKVLDVEEVFKVVPRASKYRRALAHGSGGTIDRPGSDETGKVFGHQQYLYYLARLLVLAKLGGSTGHPGMRYYAPKLVPA